MRALLFLAMSAALMVSGFTLKSMAAGKTFKDCDACPEMVVIPSRSFRMGDMVGSGYSDEQPVHTVTIGYSLAVGKYEVTQAEWKAVMGSNPSRSKGNRLPVESVSWIDAQAFLGKLTEKTGHQYRLLSEAEWEYVARAGTTTDYHWGNTASHEHANYGEERCCKGAAQGRDRWVGTSPVGRFPANGFGLHDTHGNLSEWVMDCWHINHKGAPTDGSARAPRVQSDCLSRVLRGGSWLVDPWYVRVAARTFADFLMV